MKGQATATHSTAEKPTASAAPKSSKRAYHNKVRTGCRTCKIRRIRCDESKPSCTRCISTGRKCDGYATSTVVPLPQAPWSTQPRSAQSHEPSPDFLGSDLALTRHRGTPAELKAYSFFLEVTAPCVAGALHTDFWMYEVPRISDSDPSVWHAAVSLGAIHSNYINNLTGREANRFALEHYNSSIRGLCETYSPGGWWRALAVSTIFACICILDCQYEQARLHFQGGFKILREFADDDLPHDKNKASKKMLSNLPVSLSSIRSMLITFELIEMKLDRKKTSQPPTLLSQDDKYSLWKSYTIPLSLPGRYLTADNLITAVVAAESFFMALIIQLHKHAKETKAFYKDGNRPCKIIPCEEEFHGVFLDLDRVIGLFKAEIDRRAASKMKLRKAYLSLCVIHAANRFLLIKDPQQPDDEKRLASLPSLCEEIVDMSQEVLDLGGNLGGLSLPGPITNSTIMNPLLVVAKSGSPMSVRRRAVEQLYRQRLEGVWDSRLGAGIGEAIIRRETEATKQYRNMPELDNLQLTNSTARPWGSPEDEDYVHPLARVCNTSLGFLQGRNVMMGLRTWREWLHDVEPEEVVVSW